MVNKFVPVPKDLQEAYYRLGAKFNNLPTMFVSSHMWFDDLSKRVEVIEKSKWRTTPENVILLERLIEAGFKSLDI